MLLYLTDAKNELKLRATIARAENASKGQGFRSDY